MVSKGFPNVTTSGRQYNIGEKPSVILYTCCYIINFSMQGHQNHNLFYVRVLDYRQCSNMVLYDLREVKVKFSCSCPVSFFSLRRDVGYKAKEGWWRWRTGGWGESATSRTTLNSKG